MLAMVVNDNAVRLTPRGAHSVHREHARSYRGRSGVRHWCKGRQAV